jgi:hypothetical protein
MSGITKDAIEKIEQLIRSAEPIVEYGGELFARESLTRVESIGLIDEEIVDDDVCIHSLGGVATYLNDNPDGLNLGELIVVVGSGGNEVRVDSMLFGNKQRETYLTATPLDTIGKRTDALKFGEFVPLEDFNIKLRAWFVEDEELVSLLKVLENIRTDDIAEVSDDGMSQQVQVRSGVASVTNQVVKRRPTLRPFRTFAEVQQPAQEFVLRLRKHGEHLITAALFEADGGKWRLEASANVAKYLEENIEGDVTIIY